MSKHVVKGMDQLRQVATLIASLNPNKRWAVSISEHRERRSLEQNDRFHALIASVATETGNDPGAVKEFAKQEWGPKLSLTIDGVVRTVPKPSRAYNVAEMSEVMDRFEAWAAIEYGLTV